MTPFNSHLSCVVNAIGGAVLRPLRGLLNSGTISRGSLSRVAATVLVVGCFAFAVAFVSCTIAASSGPEAACAAPTSSASCVMMSDGEMLPAIALELRPFTPRAHFQGAISLVIDPNGEAELVDYSPYGLRVERRLLGRIPAEKVRLWQRRLESPGMWKMTTPPPHLVMEGDIFELRASASNSTPRGLGGNLSLASEGLKELVDELLQASLALKAAPACVGYLRITVHPGVPPPRRVRLEDLSPRIREMVQSTHRRGRTFSPLDAEAAAAVSKVGQQLFVEHEKRVFELMQFSSREAAPNPNQ